MNVIQGAGLMFFIVGGCFSVLGWWSKKFDQPPPAPAAVIQLDSGEMPVPDLGTPLQRYIRAEKKWKDAMEVERNEDTPAKRASREAFLEFMEAKAELEASAGIGVRS
jgi:hypothetical protein